MHRRIALVVAPFALALGMVTLAAGQNATPGPADCGTPVASPMASPDGSPSAMATPDGTPTSAGECVTVTLNEWSVEMPDTLMAGSTTFVVTNAGTVGHSFEIEGQEIEEELEATLQPGETATLTVDLAAGSYEAYCPVGNHKGQGMELDLTVR